MQELAIIKIGFILPIILILGALVKFLKDQEEKLLLQEISWQEFQLSKEFVAVAGGFILFCGALIAI